MGKKKDEMTMEEMVVLREEWPWEVPHKRELKDLRI